MDEIVDVREAKAQLSRLLERVTKGEEFVISKSGRAVARLVPYETRHGPRVPGGWKGKVWMADNWDSDEVNRQIEAMFYGEDN